MPKPHGPPPGLHAADTASPLRRRGSALSATLETPRLTLGSVRGGSDEVDLYERLYGSPEVIGKSGDGRTKGPVEAAAVLAAGVATWRRGDPLGPLAVVRRDTGAHIGIVSLRGRPEPGHAELGYLFDKSVWGRGYGREAIQAVVTHLPPAVARGPWRLHKEPLHTLLCGTRADNPASLKILRHLGFEEVGRAFVLGASRVNFRRPALAPSTPAPPPAGARRETASAPADERCPS